MFTSPVLRMVGLVWKPIKANATTKRNSRLQAKRVADVEAFLRPYRLSAWNRASYDNAHSLSKAKVVTFENYELEKQSTAILVAKREKRIAKTLERKRLADLAKQTEADDRAKAAKGLVEQLRKEGQMKPYPTF